MIEHVIEQIKNTLKKHDIDYQKIIDDFGQIRAYENRLLGKTFNLNEHVKGLIYAQLSNQRPWGAIAENLEKIDLIFHNYNIEILKEKDSTELVAQIREIKCGNRRIAAQMKNLRSNIELFEKIIAKFVNLDYFVTSKKPEAIAKELGSGKTYKLKEVGFTLAMEYLRNIGINAIKPDRHICRLIGPERLRFIDKEPSPEEAYLCLTKLAQETSDCAIYIDNLLWIFAARDYGNICTANPRCSECEVNLCAKNPCNELG